MNQTIKSGAVRSIQVMIKRRKRSGTAEKARTQREKAKNKGMKERIAEETSVLREHNRDLQVQMKTMFQKDKVPAFCRTTFFYYSLYYARGLKERLIGFITFLICFLVLPCGIYFLLPDRKIWYLVLVYFADIIIFRRFVCDHWKQKPVPLP